MLSVSGFRPFSAFSNDFVSWVDFCLLFTAVWKWPVFLWWYYTDLLDIFAIWICRKARVDVISLFLCAAISEPGKYCNFKLSCFICWVIIKIYKTRFVRCLLFCHFVLQLNGKSYKYGQSAIVHASCQLEVELCDFHSVSYQLWSVANVGRRSTN